MAIPSEASNSEPVFLIDGNQRSGTNLVLGLLDGHPDIAALPTDTRTFTGIQKGLTNNDEMRCAFENDDAELFLDLLKNEKWVNFIRKSASQGFVDVPKGTHGDPVAFPMNFTRFWEWFTEQVKALPSLNLASICILAHEAIWFGLHGDFHPGRALLAKNHGLALEIDLLVQTFPHAKIVHMVRNPLSVLASQKKRYSKIDSWNKKRRKVYNWQYKKYKEAAFAYPSNVLFIRFEDLIDNTGKTMKTICEFLGIAYKEKILSSVTVNGENRSKNSSIENEPLACGRVQKNKTNACKCLTFFECVSTAWELGDLLVYFQYTKFPLLHSLQWLGSQKNSRNNPRVSQKET